MNTHMNIEMKIAETILKIVAREFEIQQFDLEIIQTVIQKVERQLENRCGHIMTRGKNIGGACDRRCPGELYCRSHAKIYVDESHMNQCAHIFKAGKKKNFQCQRFTVERYCKTHTRQHRDESEEKKEEIVEDPVQIIEIAPEPKSKSNTPTQDLGRYKSLRINTGYVDPIESEKIQTFLVDSESSEPEPEPEPVKTRKRRYEDQELDTYKEPTYADFIPTFSLVEREDSTDPYLEYGSDDDEEIDESDLTEFYKGRRDWGCQFWVEKVKDFCQDKTTIGEQFCNLHKKNYGKIPYKLDLHKYPLLEVNTVFYKNHMTTGQIWFPRMLLVAKITSEGLVVIGRMLGNRWLRSLNRREVKRCENNGLLYKVLPQEVIHYNYHIPDPETIQGQGFTSYDQIRWKRPKLYIKYWNIWNSHIQKRKQFIQTYQKETDPNKWMRDHTCPLPDWDQVKKEHYNRGWGNMIIPSPTLEQLADTQFDPWEYCDEWYNTHHKEKDTKPHFPPMYIDYPNPQQMRFRPYPQQIDLEEYEVKLNTPRRTKHYTFSPDTWLERITVKGKEWDEIYF